VRCANCGGELSRPTRFCPHCSAPQPEFEGPAEAPSPPEPRLDETPAPERSRWASAHASAVLVFLAAAIVVFAVMAVAFGWIAADVVGL
jgi:hypothetical protein